MSRTGSNHVSAKGSPLGEIDALIDRFASLVVSGEGNSDRMIATLEAILDIEPERDDDWIALAAIYEHRGDLPNAEATLSQAAHALPADEGIATRLREIRLSRADAAERHRQWTQLAGRIDSTDSWQDLLSLRVLAARRRDNDLANRALARLVRIVSDGQWSDDCREIATALRKDGQTDLAIDILEAGRPHRPNDQYLLISLGAAYRQAKRLAAAEQTYADARAIDDSVEARTGLGGVRRDQGQHIEAEGLAQSVLEEKPTHFGAWNLLGGIYRDLGRDEEAIRCFDKAIKCGGTLGREDRSELSVLAQRFAEKGDMDRAAFVGTILAAPRTSATSK